MPRPKLFPAAPRPAPPSRAVELRIWERLPCDVPAYCQPVATGGGQDFSWYGKIRDVSVRGIGLVLSRRFERGACLVIELPPSDSLQPGTLLARVVHTTPMPKGSWLHGCPFPTELSEHELQCLVSLVAQQPVSSGGPPRAERPTARSGNGGRGAARGRQPTRQQNGARGNMQGTPSIGLPKARKK
jgi:hypothetical protein